MVCPVLMPLSVVSMVVVTYKTATCLSGNMAELISLIDFTNAQEHKG